MTSDEVITALKAEKYGVVMFYGPRDITPGSNFFFAVLPKRGVMHAQWHRDIMPALKKFIKARYGKALHHLVTGTEAYEDGEGIKLLYNRAAGKNNRLWISFEWDQYRNGVFKEVEFNG